MAKIRPASVLSMMPVDDVVNHSLRYLKIDSNQEEKFRIVLLPFGDWGDCGFAIGRGVDSLDFPDNSVLFISVHRAKETKVILPPSNSMMDCPGGSFPSIDNGVIDFLCKNTNHSFSVDWIEDSEAILSLPMVIETSKMRRRGIPLCTPIIIEISDDEWNDIPSIIWEMMDGFGLGAVIHTSDMTIPMRENGERILRSAVSSLAPSFISRAMRMVIPDMTPDIAPVEMFQRLAWENGGSPRLISDSKSADEDGVIWLHHSFGLSESTKFQEPIPPPSMGAFWDAIHFAISGEGDEGVVPDVKDVILDVRMNGSSLIDVGDSTSSLEEQISRIERLEIRWEDETSTIDVRIHHRPQPISDHSRFRPKPGTSVMIEMQDGNRRLIRVPKDMRSVKADISDLVSGGGVSKITGFSMQSLSSPICLLANSK